MRPDGCGRSVLGPDVAVGEADLAADGFFPASAPPLHDLRGHGIGFVPAERRIAANDGRNRAASVERADQFLRSPGCTQATPSTTSMRVFAARSRISHALPYSGVARQVPACSRLGNSITTMRCGFQSPSNTCVLPPRARNLPPWAATEAPASLRYSSIFTALVTVISTITYAAMTPPGLSSKPLILFGARGRFRLKCHLPRRVAQMARAHP